MALDSYYTTFEVKERGWNATMIAHLMPRADAERDPWTSVGGRVKLYLRERVEELETTEDFLIIEETTRKKTEKRLQSQEAVIAAYVAQFKPRFQYARCSGQLPRAFCCEQAVNRWQKANAAAAKGFSDRRLRLATAALLNECRALFDRRFPDWKDPAPTPQLASWPMEHSPFE